MIIPVLLDILPLKEMFSYGLKYSDDVISKTIKCNAFYLTKCLSKHVYTYTVPTCIHVNVNCL